MCNRYHHAYQINQENMQKSLFKTFFIVMKFQTPPLSTGHNSQVRKNIENILLADSCH